MIPIALILLASTAAFWVAYGVDPSVAQHCGDLGCITTVRTLQWILLALCILPCMGLIAYVGLGKCRAWWMLGLAIVLALLLHRFAPGSSKPVRILETSNLVRAIDLHADLGDEYVVGFEMEGSAFAIPCRSLYRTPIMTLTDFDQRVVITWSPFANLATVHAVSPEVRGSDLEFVSSPGNSTLVYNHKYGQYIVGVTGLTTRGEKPTGYRSALATHQMPWRHWLARHPQSYVLEPADDDTGLPAAPLMPRWKTVDQVETTAETIFVRTTPPVALPTDAPLDHPINGSSGSQAFVLLRTTDGLLHAYGRTVQKDLHLNFDFTRDRKGRALLNDKETHSTWTLQGQCVDGELKGERLTEIPVVEPVYLGIVKRWFPDAVVVK